MTWISDIYSAIMFSVQSLNALSKMIANVLPQTTLSAPQTASDPALVFDSSQLDGFMLIQTSTGGGGIVKVPLRVT